MSMENIKKGKENEEERKDWLTDIHNSWVILWLEVKE